MDIIKLNTLVNEITEQQAKITKLYALTGMDIDKLIELFAKGYTLVPPKPSTETLAHYVIRAKL